MKLPITLIISLVLFFFACNNQKETKEEKPSIKTDTTLSDTLDVMEERDTVTEIVEEDIPAGKDNYFFIGTSKYITYFGCYIDGKWKGADQSTQEMEAFVDELYAIADYHSQGKIKLKKPGLQDEICDCPDYQLESETIKGNVVAMTGDWNPYDFSLEETGEYNKTVLTTVNNILVEKNLSPIEETDEFYFVLDFDQDGKKDLIYFGKRDEVNEQYTTKKGSFTLIMAIMDIEGKATPLKIAYKFFEEDALSEMENMVAGELEDILDLNGDGIPELIISDGYYEGGGSDIYVFEDGKFKFLFGCMCGT